MGFFLYATKLTCSKMWTINCTETHWYQFSDRNDTSFNWILRIKSHFCSQQREDSYRKENNLFFIQTCVYRSSVYRISFCNEKKKKKLIIYWDEQYVTMNLILEMKPEVPDFHQIFNYFKINITLCSTYKYYNLQMNI